MKLRRLFFPLFLLLLAPFNVRAGGPISISPSGVPSTWEMPISVHPESGTCASFSNADMVDKLTTDLSQWEDIPGITLQYDIIPDALGVDVTVDNYTDYLVLTSSDPGLTDGLNPVIFDDNGAITDDVFGHNMKFNVLGFAGPDAFADADYLTISGGQGVFNCRCLAGNAAGDCPGNVVFSEDDLDFTMTHELGHMTGLDHSAVNEDLADNCDVDMVGDCNDVPTMYPISEDPADQISITRDDEVAMLTLYGLAYLESNYVTVTGTVLDADDNPLRCADVQAQTDDPADTISIISGIFAPNVDLNGDALTDGTGECLSNCGDFILRGLDPAKDYTIVVKPLSSRWTSGSGIYPCDPQLTTISETTIGSLPAGSVAAGQTQSLGEIKTTSTEGVGSGGDGDSSGSSSGGCTLRPLQEKGHSLVLFMGFLLFLPLFLTRRFRNDF